jgi:integrase
MTALAPLPQAPLSDELATTIERARAYADASKASATRKAYAADLRDFEAYCMAIAAEAFPAEPAVVATYLAHLAETKSVATIRRRMVAVGRAHKERGLESPVAHPKVQEVAKGIARTKGVSQVKKEALTADRLRDALLAVMGDELKAKRDRALLLLGFAIAARRSELAALDYADVRFDKRGVAVTLRRSKTDQAGEGRTIGVPFVANVGLCAARALREWIIAAELSGGPLFRTFTIHGTLTENRIDPKDVARLVKRVAKAAGIEGDFGGHSLRAGFITTAAATKGVSEADIQRVSGHRSIAILRGYVRRATVFDDAPLAAMFG